jgi:hypothetical protein
MKAAGAALLAAALFFAGILFGSQGRSVGAPIPRPVVVVATGGPGASERTGPRNAPAPGDLDVETVERPVEEGAVEDDGEYQEYEPEDDNAERDGEEPEREHDNSGPGSDDSGSDNSGPGSDNSGPGSTSSGSGGSGSGGGGSGSGGSGSGGSGSG